MIRPVVYLPLILIFSAASALAQYSVTILPVPSGVPDDVNTGLFFGGISQNGQVAGYLKRNGITDMAVRWTNGVATALPLPSGFTSISEVVGINDAGQVAAQICPISGSNGGCQGVVWNGTTPTVIPHYPTSCASNTNPATYISNVGGINQSGHVAGETYKADNCAWGWIWDGSSFIDELTYAATCLGPTTVGLVEPLGVNDSDHVVSDFSIPNGLTGTCPQGQVTPGIMIPGNAPAALGVPVNYTMTSFGNNINNSDQTYGQSPAGAFFWNGSSYTDVSAASFVGLNNHGQAILLNASGMSVWQNGTATLVPLPSPITGIVSAASINDNGQIAARVAETVNTQTYVRIALFIPPVPITITTAPTGLTFTVDGTTLSSSQTFQWKPGSSHTVATTSPQGSGGTQYAFQNWSDSGAISHSYTVPTSATTVTATFGTQYLLSVTASPSGSGTVTLNPTATGNYYASGTTVQLTPVPSTNYSFSGWSGDLTGSAVPGVITMTASKNVTANFTAGTTKLTASIPRQLGLPLIRLWEIELTNGGTLTTTGVQITSLTLTQTAGTTCSPSPKLRTVLPVTVGSGTIAPETSASATLDLDDSGCSFQAAFTVTIGFKAAGGYTGSTVLTNVSR